MIYLGTASGLLFPALRIGWLVALPALAEPLLNAKAIADTGTATLEQLAFADFIREGQLERHVRRARLRHAAREGVHVLLRLEELRANQVRALREACRERGVGVFPAAPFYARPPARAELLLGYAALGEKEIREGVRRLRRALDAAVI